MKHLILILFFISVSLAFAQEGLGKKRDEIKIFISRPEYKENYPNFTEEKQFIVTGSLKGEKLVAYKFNQYNRCIEQIERESFNESNYKATLEFYKKWLKILEFKQEHITSNVYHNSDKRIIATLIINNDYIDLIYKNY